MTAQDNLWKRALSTMHLSVMLPSVEHMEFSSRLDKGIPTPPINTSRLLRTMLMCPLASSGQGIGSKYPVQWPIFSAHCHTRTWLLAMLATSAAKVAPCCRGRCAVR